MCLFIIFIILLIFILPLYSEILEHYGWVQMHFNDKVVRGELFEMK